MEAVRRKQTKRAKAKPTATAVSATDAAVASAASAAAANGTTRANGNCAVYAATAAVGHSSEEEAWELDADDETESSTRRVDSEIAQHEDDIMELLGGTATTLRIPTVSSSVGSLPGDVGTLTAAAAPSAPDFDDSDDEETAAAVRTSPAAQPMPAPAVLPGVMAQDAPLGTVPAQRSAIPTAPEIALPAQAVSTTTPSTTTTVTKMPVTRARPSAPDGPSDSPLIPANSGVAAASMMPSAPLEEDDVEEDLGELSRAYALRTMAPTAPALLQEEHVETPVVISAASAPAQARDASLRDSNAQGRRIRIAVPDDRVEKAGDTVRTSIAKLRSIDVSNRLYPTVLQTQASTSEENAVHSRSQFKSPAEKHPVFIKLEPHSNFEMNLLRAAASQKRQEAKMHSIEINKGDLYGRLERYLYAEYLLHTASTTLDARKKEADIMVQKVWLLEMKRLSSAKKCGDQIDIEEVLEFQTARFDAAQHAKLKAHLESIRQLRTVEASLHTFDRALSYFHVEQYLNEVVQEPAFVSYLNKMSAATMAARSKTSNFGEFDVVPETISFYEALPTGSTLASTVEHLKYCIDVMIFFEKKVTVDDQGLFGRVPSSFARGELVWQSSSTGRPTNGGTERKVKCYACNTLNTPMEPNHWCKLCASCGVVLFLPPSSVSNKSNDWYTSVLRFRQSLQKWISLCLRTLLRLRSLVNMPYLLMHVMYLPRISTEERSWILRFLQFPKAVVTLAGTVRESWSEDLVDHYVAMLHLVFHPEKLRRLTTLVSSELPSRHKGSKERKGDASLEWVLLENPEMLDRCYLSDEDFVAVINQFPHTFAFEQLFSCTMDTKKCFSRALALVIEFTQGLRLFQEFEKFPARVAQLLGELLLNASMVTAASSSANASGEGFFYPTLFDQLFLTALHGLLVADCNRVAWRSIRTFPFAPLSALAKWDVLGLLLFGISNVPGVAKSAGGWSQFIDNAGVGRAEKLKPARMVLHDQIISDPDNAMHLMHAVARLAASAKSDHDASVGRDLVLVTTQELFLAGFANSDCRQALGESGERAAGPISTICLAHPWVISELIALLFKYHECAETWIHVFETFPVNRWLPTPADLTNLQEWLLLDDTSSPRSALARFLLDRINWEFDVKAGQLFTNAFLHRQVALVVAEAMLVHRNRRRHGARDGSTRQTNGDGIAPPPKLKSFTKSIRRVFRLERPIDFERWCWKLMLKLKFYSPRTHQPFVGLVDLRNDRSREALLLRRWFPGGAGSAVTSAVSSIHFFESYDQLLNPFGTQSGTASSSTSSHEDFSHRVALVGSGSSGAPIQDDTAIATTEEDGESANLSGSAELVASVTVSSTCVVEPIVAYLICQATTFVFSERMDRWEPLLVLLKNGFFSAGVKVLENVLPLMAKLDRVSRSRIAIDNGGAAGSGEHADHALSICMATMESFSTDQLLQLVQAMEQHSFISTDECQLLSDVLQKGYIGGWESTAKAKVIAKLRFVRECSSYIHPLVLPSLINESFPQSGSSSAMVSTAAMLQGAMSWLTSALRGGHSDPPSPSAANSIASALTIRKSHLVATVPTAASAPAVTAAAAAASLGIVDAPGDYTTATQQLCTLIERAFEASTTAALNEIVSFWAKAVLHVPLWYEHPALRHIFDVLFRCSMRAYYSISSAKKTGTSIPGSRAGIHPHLVSILRSAFARHCVDLKHAAERDSMETFDGDLPAVVSFLPAVSSVPALASIFGGNADPSQFIGGCSAFALWALLVEVRQELPLFLAMGQVLVKYEPAAMKKVEKFKKTESKLALELGDVGLVGATNRVYSLLYAHVSLESLSQFKIYRFAAYCLQMREDDELQILFWQVFFALYFACAGGTRVFGHFFLDREESSNPSHPELRKLLQEKLRAMTTFCSNQAQLVLTVSGGSATGNLTSEGKELKYHHFVQLSHIYTAMDAWLEESDPNKWLSDEELATLPRHFEVARLKEVLGMSSRLLNTSPDEALWESLPLWLELCGFEFHTQVLQSGRPHGEDGEEENGEQQESTPVMTTMDHLQEEDFAFIDDRDMRRYSSLGSSADHGRTTNPLQLTADYIGPASLTVLPQVSIETLPDRCSITPSVPLNKHALKTLSTKFSETLSILVGLDAEILDHVSKLYVSKARIITESKSCLEGTNCRKPATFRFEFQEWAMDKQLMDTVQSTVTQAERYEMRSMCQHSATSSSLANLLLDSEHRRNDSSLLPEGVDEFLRLDADSLMLSMQILLIDQVVQVLQVESEKLKRAVVVAQATTVEEPPKEDAKTIANEGSEGNGVAAAGESEGVGEHVIEEKVDLRAKAIRDAERQVERLHEKGLEWFRLLTDLDTKLARMVPPLREVLWRSIKQLGIAFVCVDERETCNLLHLMLEDPSRITLLSECFTPASAPARFVEMFSNLMSSSSSSKLSNEEKLVLLQRFDFTAWLSTKAPHTPSKFDRETVLSIVLGDIGANFSGIGAQETEIIESYASRVRNGNVRTPSTNDEEQVLRLYAKIIHQICGAHLDDHLEKVLHALVGVHDDYRFSNNASSENAEGGAGSGGSRMPRPAPAIVWEAIVSISTSVWQQLPFVQTEACVTFLSQHMTTMRWQASMNEDSAKGMHILGMWQRSGALKSYLDLFSQLSRTTPEQHKWTMISTFFEPLLTTLYQPASTTESSTVSCPWTESDAMTTGTTLCSCFVAICTDFLKAKSNNAVSSKETNVTADRRSTQSQSLSSKEKLDLVWGFYLNTLIPHAPVHVCKSFHQFLTRLGWEHWCLTIEIVHQMREVVQTERQQLTASASVSNLREASGTSSPYPFVSWMVRDVLCRMTWKSTEDWLATQTEAIRSVFLGELGKLCIDLVLDLPHFQPPQPRSKNGRGGTPTASSSSNVLPPYFVNFVKQQSTLWFKWKMNDAELESFLSYTFDAVMEPIRDLHRADDTAVFPSNPSVAVMQDAFLRLQLVLRRVSQVTTLNHSTMPKRDCLKRANLFFKMAFTIFENGMTSVSSAGEYSAIDPSAWVTVLFGATCTVLFEKLDEIVQLSRVASESPSSTTPASPDDSISEEDLQVTVVEVLRLFNLRLVEGFFKREQHSDSTLSSNALAWGKCGNVIFVEVDSLIRDFSATHKLNSHSRHAISIENGDDPANGNGSNAIKQPTSVVDSIGNPLGRLLWSFMGFRGGELCCLSACGRAIASVHVMSVVAERSIEKWIIEERRGSWEDLVSRLRVPELSEDEFEGACLMQGHLLTLQLLFLQQLKKAPAMTEAFAIGMLSKLMTWMEKLHLINSTTALMEMKMLFLAAEVTNFVHRSLAEVLPSNHKKQMLRELCNIMLRFGNARRQHGIMKAIGIGGSLKYNVEFHVCCLTIGVFLRLQTRNGAPLRVDDRIPYKLTRTTEKHIKSLEQLLASKNCFQLHKRMEWMVDFLKSPSRSLADQDEFFVSLFSRIYPSHPWMLAKCINT